MPTIDQERSQFAWKCAEEGISVAGSSYTNLAKAAPALIMNNGLMQTLAFFESKGERHHKCLSTHLRNWISMRHGNLPRADFQPFMQAMLDSDSSKHQRATEEALQVLRWIRQFAAAMG